MAGQARRRLDAELVRRRLARSREQAVELIAAGRVSVGGARAAKAATQVETSAAIVVAQAPEGEPGYASRGGHKLAGALAAFGEQSAQDGGEIQSGSGQDGSTQDDGSGQSVSSQDGGDAQSLDGQDSDLVLRVAGRRALDAGASTGGFTDVLLRAGVRQVVAVDVGYGQLVWELQNDPRVVVVDRTNVRELTLDQIGDEPVELVVGDLSFISLTLVLPALVRCAVPEADLVLMVKPQFEVGRDRLGAGGVVRDTALHAEAVRTVAAAAAGLGLGVLGVTASPLPGPSGNVEYFLWLRRGAPELQEQDLARAVAEGPAGGGVRG
jgi:23S rRNA (cytidine1920-2'-O)/16S rRNA (cytidine1409-2'-O)-methyltransferase